MGSKYFPYSEHICHHVFNKGGCNFCGFHMMKNCVSSTPITVEQMIQHFDEFVNDEKNYQDILQRGRLSVETEGSWFLEVPRGLRQHIYRFLESRFHGLELHTQCRATLINEEKTRTALAIAMKAKNGPDFDKKLLERTVQETLQALNTELKPYMFISSGLEVADDSDLELINKGCQLNDYLLFSQFIRSHGAKFVANVLIAPPLVQDPVRKALKTAQYAFEVLEAAEITILSCIPRLRSRGQGKWIPISATESAEIFRIIKDRYLQKEVRLDTMRVYCFHGKYGPKIKTEEQKIAAREKVRKIAKEVFKSS